MCDEEDVTGPVPDSWLGRDCEYFHKETENVRDYLDPKEDLIAKFNELNYTVFAAMLLVSAGIGVFFWWKVKILN